MRVLPCLLPALLLASSATAQAAPPDDLAATIAALDTAAFAAFNDCAAPGKLDKYASYFAPDVEFYQTWAASRGRATT